MGALRPLCFAKLLLLLLLLLLSSSYARKWDTNLFITRQSLLFFPTPIHKIYNQKKYIKLVNIIQSPVVAYSYTFLIIFHRLDK